MDNSIIYKNESYKLIGACMDVHNELGHGFSEIIYKDALEVSFQQENISYSREKKYNVYFKDILLPHKFYADFVVFNKIILEVKCVSQLTNEHISQTINYLKASKCN